ncbi:MAG: chemotaxis protein CheW [Pseudomonadota bacterium]
METIEEVRGAASVAPEAAPQLAGEFLICRLGAEEYGIDILQVQEIRSYEPPTSIANAPAFIKGVINLRGVIVPILDLRLKFSLKAEYNDLTVVIVLNIGRRVVGVVVDAVSDVLPLSHAQIRPVPELDAGADTRFITGIGTADGDGRDRMLILVDIGQLIAASDIDLGAAGLG